MYKITFDCTKKVPFHINFLEMTGCQASLYFYGSESKTFLQLQENSNTLQKKGAFLGIPEAIIHVECVSGVGPSGTFPRKTRAKGRPQFASTARKGYLQPLGRILISSRERSEDHSSQDTSLALLLLLCSTTFTKSASSPLKRGSLYSIEELMVFWSLKKFQFQFSTDWRKGTSRILQKCSQISKKLCLKSIVP